MSSRKNKRYFSDVNEDKYTVGKLSPNLRHALGLEHDMLPFWIYRMRILGYPPVWLQAAESKTLAVNDGAKSNRPSSSLANGEDGELNDNLKYNKDTLIEYPGFNAPVPKNVRDDWVILGMPPYQQNQRLDVAAESMQFIEPVPYKRAKLDEDSNSTNDSNTNSDNNNESNTNKSESVVLVKTEDNVDHDENINDDRKNSKELQPEKEKVKIKSEEQDEIIKTNTNDEQNSTNQSSNHEEKEKETNEISTTTVEKKMKIVSYGTAVPQTVRPKLPSLEKWSIGMGELLHFENLPTSTGAYKDKIKNIIEKVRNRFTKK